MVRRTQYVVSYGVVVVEVGVLVENWTSPTVIVGTELFAGNTSITFRNPVVKM